MDDCTRHALNSVVNGNTRLIHTNISDYETIRFLFDDSAHEHGWSSYGGIPAPAGHVCADLGIPVTAGWVHGRFMREME